MHYDAHGSIGGWLMRVARTTCHRAVAERRRRAGLTLLIDVPSQTPPDAVEAVRSQNAEDDRESALLQLSPRRLAVVVYRLGFGYSVQETADLLHVKPGTVKATLHQAIKQLRRNR